MIITAIFEMILIKHRQLNFFKTSWRGRKKDFGYHYSYSKHNIPYYYINMQNL